MRFRRVVISRHGEPDVLQVIEDELREPTSGEVLIRVQAAGVAWADVMMRTGLYPGKMPPLPFTPGYDVAGVLEKAGPGVRLSVGQPLVAITKFGGYSEYAWVPEAAVVPTPEGLDPAEATCLPLNYLTAYQMLHRFAKVKAGERVLIHGAAGGVGTALLQLGRLAGVEMLGTASEHKHAAVQELGAIPIDYQKEDFTSRVQDEAPGGIDAVFDPIGGKHLRLSYSVLKLGGRLIAYGERAIVGSGFYNAAEAAEQEEFLNWQKTDPGGKTVQWYEVYDHVLSDPDWYQADMRALLQLLASRQITPVIAERLPLERAGHAQSLLEATAVTGKVVLIT